MLQLNKSELMFQKYLLGVLTLNQQKIDRINELSRKSKTEGLTEEEKAEQTMLRNEYRQSVIGNLAVQLDNTYIMTPDGKKTKVKQNGK